MSNTVLIIDDNKLVRESVSEILKLSNYKVHCAVNGKEGLEMAQKTNPNIILCDVMMPELDGYGVLRGLTNNPQTKNIPFVFISSKSEKEELRKGMDLGADDYLPKPFSGDELLSLLNTRLAKSQALKTGLNINKENLESLFTNSSLIENIYNVSDKIRQKKLRKKDILYMEEEPAKYVYFVVSGKIKTFRTNEQGKQYIDKVYKEKDFFGHSSLLEGNTYKESAIAIEDSEIASIKIQDFYQLLLSNNEAHLRFIQLIISDLSETNDKLLKLAYDSARKRVAEALLYLAFKYHTNLTDNLMFSICRHDISAISGVSPESVSRNLTDLRAERLIELQNGKVKILNVKKLAELKN